MNEDSKPGRQQGGGRKEEGIAALGRRVAGIDVGSKEHWVCAPVWEGEGRGGAGRVSATRAAGLEEQEKSPNDPQPWTRAAAASPVSRQRSGSDGD